LVEAEASCVGENVHQDELQEGPAPGSGLALDHGEGAHALHGQYEPKHQRAGDERSPDRALIAITVCLHRGRESFGSFLRFGDAIGDAERAHEYFACSEGADEAYADLPVEAERSKRRLDSMANPAGQAVLDLSGALLALGRVTRRLGLRQPRVV